MKTLFLVYAGGEIASVNVGHTYVQTSAILNAQCSPLLPLLQCGDMEIWQKQSQMVTQHNLSHKR